MAELSACTTIQTRLRFDHLAIDVKLRHFPVAASGFSTRSSMFAALGLLYGKTMDTSRLPDLALATVDSSNSLNFSL